MPEAQTHHGPDRRILTFAGVMAAIFLSALDQTIVGTSMPRIAAELNGFSQYNWVTVAYLLTSTAVVPVVGKLSQELGRKRVFLTGIVLFLIGSALCGAAQNMTQLIAFRGFQGIGGGVLTGTAFAVIADLFTPAERGKYTGMVAGVFGLASIIGPLAGGYLTDNVSWRAIFYVNIPIGLVVLAGLYFTFPPMHKVGSDKPRIDFRGAAGIGLGAAAVTLGLSLVNDNGWGYPPVWFLIIAGIALVTVTMFYEGRIEHAVMPPQLYTSSIFALSMIVTFLTGVLMFGVIIYIPVFLQGVVGVSATQSGTLMLPLMAGMVVGSIGGGFAVSKTGRYKVQAILGFASMALGMFLLTGLTVDSTQSQVAVYMIAIGLGMGLSMPVFNVISQNAVPHRFMSSATSSIQFVRQMGGTVGLAILGALFTQSFKTDLAHNVPRSLLAQLPAALRAKLSDVNNLFNPANRGSNPTDASRLAHLPPSTQEAVREAIHGLKLALTQSITHNFSIALGVAAVALGTIFFIREIPLRRSHGAELNAQPGEGVAPEVAFG